VTRRLRPRSLLGAAWPPSRSQTQPRCSSPPPDVPVLATLPGDSSGDRSEHIKAFLSQQPGRQVTLAVNDVGVPLRRPKPILNEVPDRAKKRRGHEKWVSYAIGPVRWMEAGAVADADTDTDLL
jgi:hypothetical protein